MRITRSIDLPGAPADVFAVMLDEGFQRSKLPGDRPVAKVDVTGNRAVVRTQRTLPTKDLPEVARRSVGESLTIIEEQAWGPEDADGRRQAAHRLTVHGVPVSMTGTLLLAPHSSGSVLSMDGDLRCSLPLVGAKIEKSAAPGIIAAFDDEAKALRVRLTAG